MLSKQKKASIKTSTQRVWCRLQRFVMRAILVVLTMIVGLIIAKGLDWIFDTLFGLNKYLGFGLIFTFMFAGIYWLLFVFDSRA